MTYKVCFNCLSCKVFFGKVESMSSIKGHMIQVTQVCFHILEKVMKAYASTLVQQVQKSPGTGGGPKSPKVTPQSHSAKHNGNLSSPTQSGTQTAHRRQRVTAALSSPGQSPPPTHTTTYTAIHSKGDDVELLFIKTILHNFHKTLYQICNGEDKYSF